MVIGMYSRFPKLFQFDVEVGTPWLYTLESIRCALTSGIFTLTRPVIKCRMDFTKWLRVSEAQNTCGFPSDNCVSYDTVDENPVIKRLRSKLFFLKIFGGHESFFGPLIPLFWTSGDICPGFQSQGRSLACVLSHLHTRDASDSSLVRHLPTSWQPAWQPIAFPTSM